MSPYKNIEHVTQVEKQTPLNSIALSPMVKPRLRPTEFHVIPCWTADIVAALILVLLFQVGY